MRDTVKHALLTICTCLTAVLMSSTSVLAQAPVASASPNPPAADHPCPQNACLAPQLVYIGTHTKGGDEAIHAARFDPETGTLSDLGKAAVQVHPTWLMPSPHRQVLYVANANGVGMEAQGEVLSFTANPADGSLSLLSRVASGGGAPRHLALAGMPPTIFVANYASGQVAAIPLQKGGALLPPSAVVSDSGAAPHVQAVLSDPGGKHLFVADFGVDRVFVYRIDSESHGLKPSPKPYVALPAGSGPRRLALSTDGRFVYALTQTSAQLVTLAWDADREELSMIGSIPLGRAAGRKPARPAELILAPDGRFAYVSDHGARTVTVYALDAASGAPTEVQRLAVEGGEPGSLAIDGTGRWLLVTSAKPGSVSVLARKINTGLVAPTSSRIAVPKAEGLAMLVP